MSPVKIERALLSVSDKSNLTGFAQGLAAAGIELYASGGTRTHLEQAGLQVHEVAAYTGFPEMLDGRLKTLHPKIHGGILCRRDREDDMQALAEHGIVPFELLVVNLYPFASTIQKPGVTPEQAIEQIDIGGPTMIRAAAKNHAFVAVACQPSQYSGILEQIRATGSTSDPLRRELARAAFAHTAAYDKMIAEYLGRITSSPGDGQPQGSAEAPTKISLSLEHKLLLRYGENPHQLAALFADANQPPDQGALVGAEQLNGKELSYNNLLDLDSALAIARALPRPGVAVLKHNNPCGAATATTIAVALERAWDGDPVSAFGSILGFNVPVDAAAAEFLCNEGRFVEAIIAPEYDPQALEILTTKPKWKANVRLLRVGRAGLERRHSWQLRQIDGGWLGQQSDTVPDDESTWQVVTDVKPTDAQRADLRFAWEICRFVKSNAIVLASDQSLVGVGAGQMSRVDASEIAIRKAGDRAAGSVLASDAFFPFDDSVRQAAAAGVAAVIQPGGSRRDAEIIAACNELRLPMIFTGRRHFRH
jgi:phosphoribosylaminoimidazolecarboxamide formyltransferase/IMP cyclohydrolase